MAHTKGPWSCNNNVGVVFGEGCQVAVCGDFHDAELVPYNADRWRADARLISLAPEMLEELEVRASDLFMLHKAIDAGDPKAELLMRVDDMLRETKALIARARGDA